MKKELVPLRLVVSQSGDNKSTDDVGIEPNYPHHLSPCGLMFRCEQLLLRLF